MEVPSSSNPGLMLAIVESIENRPNPGNRGHPKIFHQKNSFSESLQLLGKTELTQTVFPAKKTRTIQNPICLEDSTEHCTQCWGKQYYIQNLNQALKVLRRSKTNYNCLCRSPTTQRRKFLCQWSETLQLSSQIAQKLEGR